MLKKSFSKSKPVCKVTFSLPLEAAKGGKDVRVLGDFNHWSWENGFRMKSGKNEFSTEVELEAGKEYQFRYLIDNHMWENDWQADNYVPAAFGEFNSVVSLKQTATNGKAAEKKAPAMVQAKATTDKATPAAKSKVLEAKPVEKKSAAPKAVAKPKTADIKLTGKKPVAVKSAPKK